jgi:hypothetical protein
VALVYSGINSKAKKWIFLVEKRANVWLVAGDTFGRQAARAALPGAASIVAKLAEGRLSSSPLFSKARKTTKAQWQRASRLCCAPRRRRLARRRRRYPPPKRAAMAESLAASGAGAEAKTAVGVAGRLRRQWLRWLTEHGEAYEYDATVRIL